MSARLRRAYMLLCAACVIFGGYYMGYVHLPAAWPNLVIEGVVPLDSVFIGGFIGWLIGVIIVVFIETWRSA